MQKQSLVNSAADDNAEEISLCKFVREELITTQTQQKLILAIYMKKFPIMTIYNLRLIRRFKILE